MDKYWYKKSFKRNLVDMHIEDWDERFLAKFLPEEYFRMLKLSGQDSAMIYANSHVGYCYWPTKYGKMHSGLKGRDTMGELFDLCHREGINVVMYYTLIYDNWAYSQGKDWQQLKADGCGNRESKDKDGKIITTGRYGLCCPNSKPYREYTLNQIKDFASNYKFEGIFFDMTFWNYICHCKFCKERFKAETGFDYPEYINWDDPVFVLLQKKRQDWMAEFADITTTQLKKYRPDTSVNHQFSISIGNWILGVTEQTQRLCDYSTGDFYGGFSQQSFICKFFYNITNNRPFEFHTSRCLNLNDHTTTKTKDELMLHNYIAVAHNGAFMFIDAINPDGTLDERVYRTMGEVFDESKKYEKFYSGEMCQDVGIYFSLHSKNDPDRENGKKLYEGPSGRMPHLEAALNASKTLIENHIPFGVVTRKNRDIIKNYKTIIVPDIQFIDEVDKEILTVYVKNGGKLYISGKKAAIQLGELTGVIFKGMTEENVTYISPAEAGSPVMSETDKKFPLMVNAPQPELLLRDGAKALAFTALPGTDPKDFVHFISIHSNPYEKDTQNPAIVENTFGRGKVLYFGYPLERNTHYVHKNVFISALKYLYGEDFTVCSDAPHTVEIISFEDKGKKCVTFNLLNVQESLPQVPVRDITVKIKENGRSFNKVLLHPDEKAIPGTSENGWFKFTLSELKMFAMISVYF